MGPTPSGIVKSTDTAEPTNARFKRFGRSTPDAAQTRQSAGRPRELRVAIAGGGGMGRHHAQAIRQLGDGARVVAVADPDPRAQAAMRRIWPDIAAAAELAELFEKDQIDVVHVCTSPETHRAIAEVALRAGCHVYVEKPFAESAAATAEVLKLAAESSLEVCAGHQLLFERPARSAFEFLPALGELIHIESYFSFRLVRQMAGGRTAPAADAQLVDVLPHPVYLLLHALEQAAPEHPCQLEGVTTGPRGTIHAVIRRGAVSGTLIVTLEGRPVESYLRLVGTNGTVHADFVRGTVQRLVGPGVSGIDKALNPLRLGRQLIGGTVAALGGRVLKRQLSYPGLAEIFAAFYAAIRGDAPLPMQPASILETNQICEAITKRIMEPVPAAAPRAAERSASGRSVAVTGGTGFLGRKVVEVLNAGGAHVRVITRRAPAPWERIGKAEYRVADLAEPLPPDLLRGIEVVVHCAAETVGGWEGHEKNSVAATEHLMRAAAASGVERLVHVSSLSVLASAQRGALSENTPLEPASRGRGPYVWGKVESEALVTRLGQEFGIEVKIVRPGAIVDPDRFEPPGLLGKRVGNLFVLIGSRQERLAVVDVGFAARTLAWMVERFEEAPDVLHLLAPDLPSKASLLEPLRRSNPDLTVIPLPWAALVPLSWAAVAVQKVLRPHRPAVNPARVLVVDRYDTSRVRAVEEAVGEFFGQEQ
jgi:predicted dehydrogenase/nucleoside-diphosphate-sugar epimerase